MKANEAAWAAGLFEGEGCILMRPEALGSPRLALSMCDEDVVRRFAVVVGMGTVIGPLFGKSAIGTKPQWRWAVGGYEPVQFLLAAFWAGLGERRKARAAEVLLAARDVPFRGLYRRKFRHEAA